MALFRDDEQLTRHYASANSEVRRWVNKVGHKRTFVLLDRIKQGECFDRVYQAMYKDGSKQDDPGAIWSL